MRYCKKIFVICSIAFLAVSCGKKHQTESAVKEFLDQNMLTTDYTISFNELDSTRNITDSMITVMKSNAEKNSLFKKNITYNINKGDKPYIYIKAKIYNGKDTVPYTFYLDKNLQSVIAFKIN